jgi:hypothetical protein
MPTCGFRSFPTLASRISFWAKPLRQMACDAACGVFYCRLPLTGVEYRLKADGQSFMKQHQKVKLWASLAMIVSVPGCVACDSGGSWYMIWFIVFWLGFGVFCLARFRDNS